MYANGKFVSLLDDHLKRQTEGVLEDVWDGNLWKEFQQDPTDPSKQQQPRINYQCGLVQAIQAI